MYTQPMSLFFITGNPGKFAEVKTLIPEVEQIDIDLDEIQDLDPQKVIEHKLKQALAEHSGELIVEDTSLYFEGMKGLPGPLIKWFLKALKNEGLTALAQNLPSSKATAKTILGYAPSSDTIQFFSGEIKGTIVPPRGDKGFGWDAIFQPDGSEKTFGEMTLEEKTQFSMRRLAVEKLQAFLQSTQI
jgi:inosine triphosphate pyrophosphatase